jgi:hypothetical protein
MKLGNRAFLAAGLLVALLLAGVASWYASSAPDGLEKVAGDQGFISQEQEHDLEGSPFAGYETKGVDDDRLSGGLAGVAGVGATLLLGGGLFLLIRRRGTAGPAATGAGAGTDADTRQD